MKYQDGHNIRFKWAALLVILFSTLAWAGPNSDPNDGSYPGAPADLFIYIVVILVLIGSFIAIALIRAALSVSASKWSLAEALSEEVEVTAMDTDKPDLPQLDDKKKPLMVKRMCASSSRLIALMGMMVILLMFLGFGAFALYAFGKTGKVPEDIGNVVKFLLAGLTLFAPYVVNKFGSVFESLSPKPGG